MSKKDLKMEEAYGDVNLSMLADFALTNGISGHEKEIANVYRTWVEDAADAISYDQLGSVVAYKKGQPNGPKIMFAGHIDEIGFLVKSIDDRGFLRLHPVGGWWPHVLLSQPVVVTTRHGMDYVGVIGSKAPHGMPVAVRNKVMELKDLYVDMGVASKDEIELLGIQVGDAITPKADFHVLANPNYLMSKAWDNRIGAAVAAEVMRELKDVNTEAHIYSVGTVQEEVGLRGAKTSAQMIHPDIAVTIDTTIAKDTPGEEKGCELGVGVTLEVMDASYISHKGLLYHLQDLCDELDINYQFELLSAGGTDSGEIHKVHDGVITLTVSIPTRYIHSHYGIIHRKDFVDTVKLLTEFSRRMNGEVYESLVNYKR